MLWQVLSYTRSSAQTRRRRRGLSTQNEIPLTFRHVFSSFFLLSLLYVYSLADLCFSVRDDKVGGHSCFCGLFVAHCHVEWLPVMKGGALMLVVCVLCFLRKDECTYNGDTYIHTYWNVWLATLDVGPGSKNGDEGLTSQASRNDRVSPHRRAPLLSFQPFYLSLRFPCCRQPRMLAAL